LWRARWVCGSLMESFCGKIVSSLITLCLDWAQALFLSHYLSALSIIVPCFWSFWHFMSVLGST
jgi:hypothetical protein